jgi:hypothetical protein
MASLKTIILPPGTTSWPVPLDWDPNNNKIEAWGEGGGGGGITTAGGGGGGGAYTFRVNVDLTPGAVIPVQIGPGGPAGRGAHAPPGIPTTFNLGDTATQIVADAGNWTVDGFNSAGGDSRRCIPQGFFPTDPAKSGGQGGGLIPLDFQSGGGSGGGAGGPNGPGAGGGRAINGNWAGNGGSAADGGANGVESSGGGPGGNGGTAFNGTLGGLGGTLANLNGGNGANGSGGGGGYYGQTEGTTPNLAGKGGDGSTAPSGSGSGAGGGGCCLSVGLHNVGVGADGGKGGGFGGGGAGGGSAFGFFTSGTYGVGGPGGPGGIRITYLGTTIVTPCSFIGPEERPSLRGVPRLTAPRRAFSRTRGLILPGGSAPSRRAFSRGASPFATPVPDYQILFMDTGGHFYYSTDELFASWAYTISGAATNLDLWPEVRMAINDADYATILGLNATPGGATPSSYILAAGPTGIAAAPVHAFGNPAIQFVSCGLTARGQTMIFTDRGSPATSPIISINTGGSFSNITGLPSGSGQAWSSPAFGAGGSTVYIQQDGGQTWKSLDGGVTWVQLATSMTAPAGAVVNVVCSADGLVVAVSACNPATGFAQAWASSNGGSGWNTFDAAIALGAAPAMLWISASIDGQVLFLTAGLDNGVTESGGAWGSGNYGLTWEPITLPNLATQAIERCAITPDAVVLAAVYRAYKGGVQQPNYTIDWSGDGGNSWQPTSVPIQGDPGGANFKPAGVFILPSSNAPPIPTFALCGFIGNT